MLDDAIARNRARQAEKRGAAVSEEIGRAADAMNAMHERRFTRRALADDTRLKAYTVNVLVIPPNYEIALGLATMHEEKRTIYGTSLADAKKKAGIE